MKNDVLIVGGGLAGLSCALKLNSFQLKYQLLEASNRFGGRVGSDTVNGFTLDRGFQVYLDAYPSARELLDYADLKLKPFQSGALIQKRAQFGVLADPFRHPSQLPATLAGPLPFADLLRLGRLNLGLKAMDTAQALSSKDQSTLSFLKERGFTDKVIDLFWRPFLGGIFLEPDLSTSARMFFMVTSLFVRGRATLPEKGMQAIPDQLVSRLPPEALLKNSPVVEIGPRHVILSSGERLEADHVVDARDPWSSHGAKITPCGTRCFYFETETPPWKKPWLTLCPDAKHIQSLTFPTLLHPALAPEGRHLLSVSTLSMEATEDEIRSDLLGVFGRRSAAWPLLHSYRIPFALPAQAVGHLNPASRTGKNPAGIYCCGDHLETASIEGAICSGKRAADHILAVSKR